MRKLQGIDCGKKELSDEQKEHLNKTYQEQRRVNLSFQMQFAKEKQMLDIATLRQQKNTGQISYEDYEIKCKQVRADLGVYQSLISFKTLHKNLKNEIYQPQIESERTHELFKKITENRMKLIEVDGKMRRFEDIFLDEMSEKIAEEYRKLEERRLKNSSLKIIPDYGIAQIENLEDHIRENLKKVLPENLEELLKSENKQTILFSIPTTNEKSIPITLSAMSLLICQVQPIIEMQENKEVSEEKNSIENAQESDNLKQDEENLEEYKSEKKNKLQVLVENLKEKLEKNEISKEEYEKLIKEIRIYQGYLKLTIEIHKANDKIAKLKKTDDGQLEIQKIKQELAKREVLKKWNYLKNTKSEELKLVKQMIEKMTK